MMSSWSAAQAITVDGVKFPSKAQARRYCELKDLQRLGMIWQLELEPVFPLVVGGKKVGRYTADFRYRDERGDVVEEVKGRISRDYTLRKRLFQALFPGIRFVEIRG